MSPHLTPAEIEGYKLRRLDATALLAADDHLAACAECRALAAHDAPPIARLQRSFEGPHLTGAQLTAYADRRLDEPRALEHLEGCARCLDEARDLRAFAGGIQPARRRPLWLIPIWAAAAGFIGWWILVPHSALRPAPAVTASSPLPDDLRRLRDDAAATGVVAIPPEIAALRGRPGTLLGSTEKPAADLLAPIGTATLSARPTFRWTPVAGAGSYQVSVFDANFRPVIASGPLHDASWTPPRDLEPAKVYLWQLAVTTGGRTVTAPQPPAPEARFVVLPEADRARLSDAAARFPKEHLLLGVLYARAGALDEARREWQAAAAEGHTEAARLLESLR